MTHSESVVDPTKYVVLDVETNGLSSVRHDLLSISIYKPDTEDFYVRFLPLELNETVLTTHINGIKTTDLCGLFPLTQEEVNIVIRDFDLKNRTVLTYGGLDEKFITRYFQRHNLSGLDYFSFYNFKHEIISSRFSEGNITKDNLCSLFGIENVQQVHTGKNDCLLEWKLFKKLNGQRLLITNNKVFVFNEDYLVPASYISTYPNFKYYLPQLPKITCNSRIIFSLPVLSYSLKKFPTNFNGMIIEHLINSMLSVKKVDSKDYLLKNKSKLRFIGNLPSHIDVVPMVFNPDGSMTATREKDLPFEKEINKNIEQLKAHLGPLIRFITNYIFGNKQIKSQELVVIPDMKVLAMCDLSSEDSVLEIKTTTEFAPQAYADQLYYEANGRKSYVLQTDWSRFPALISFNISELKFTVADARDNILARYKQAQALIETDEISLVSYINSSNPVKLRCKTCGNEWSISYNLAKKHRGCPECTKRLNILKVPQEKTFAYRRETEEEKQLRKFTRYQERLKEKTNGQISLLSFSDSRSPALVKCLSCGYEWSARADHLIDRAYCPKCRKLSRHRKFQ